MINKLEKEFLLESNAIEGVYDDDSLKQAELAWEHAKSIKGPLVVLEVLKIHQILMKNLNPRIAGKFRTCAVWIGGHKRKQEPEAILANKVWEVLEIINKAKPLTLIEKRKLSAIAKTKAKSERSLEAVGAHILFETIHPFEDGNGRTGRLLWALHRKRLGLPIQVIHEGVEQYEYYKWFH